MTAERDAFPRTGGPIDDEADVDLVDVWAGVVPVRAAFGEPRARRPGGRRPRTTERGRLPPMTTARRRDLAVWAAGVLALVTTATTFLGWGRSGQRTRTSYELVDVADRAGVLADDAAWAAPLWFLAPAACGAILVALAVHRHAIAGALTTTLGALVGTGAILVDRSPLVAEPAVGVAVVLGGATALSGVAVLVTARKETAG